ncbi:MAG: hypothetical protein L3J97_01405 [Thermoplasmata archaeon]|nr:hypothetical protein [Thermoplasmata archaeon]
MKRASVSKVWACVTLVGLLAVASFALLTLPSAAAAGLGTHPTGGIVTLPGTTLVPAPPTGAKGADDITVLAIEGVDSGRGLIWTAYQNGINPDGSPGSPGGPYHSTLAGYDPITGSLVRTIQVTGKIDGLTAEQQSEKLIATVNEDVNSSLDIINPETGTVTTYTYSPNPAISGNGGTDSIAVQGDRIFLAHSNPNDATQATDYEVHLHLATHIAKLTPLFFDNSPATDAVSGATVRLGLTDPDTNFLMPPSGERFAGDLATIGQADGQIVFAAHLHGKPHLTVLNLTDNKTGNVPPIDGFTVATSDRGTLYVVDAKAGTIEALDTSGWEKGTVFVGEPSDNGNPLIGVLNLHTGVVTSLGNHFASPKGLLFVPAGHGDDDRELDSGHHHEGAGPVGASGLAVRSGRVA